MRMMRTVCALALGAVCFSSLVHADTAAYQAKQLAKFERYAGPPIDQFSMTSLYQWQVVGAQNVVVWPTINTAYLLTVEKPCTLLRWTNALGISQEMSMKVTQKFDFVAFDHQRCPISKIQPIDYKALRSDERKAAADTAKE
ncbi:MAG TPA: DUF6491 family protein [Rudaea sp.]|nr:DUF6491 family protein [Rudaea sp.]